MRAISIDARNALFSGGSFSRSNTRVKDGCLYLHHNKIAEYKDGSLSISLAGWATVTTRERLNALDGVNLYQKNYEQYLNGKKIDSQRWYKID